MSDLLILLGSLLDWCVPADRERILGQIDGLVRLREFMGREGCGQ